LGWSCIVQKVNSGDEEGDLRQLTTPVNRNPNNPQINQRRKLACFRIDLVFDRQDVIINDFGKLRDRYRRKLRNKLRMAIVQLPNINFGEEIVSISDTTGGDR
jgi:hypothetical protein